jgi:hypothetical protein
VTPAVRALRGITWDHPRGYAALTELERLDANADARYGAVPAPLAWDRQPLAGFESQPIADLAGRYDLLVIDHPGRPLGRRSAPIVTPATSGRCHWTQPPRSAWSGPT